MITTRAPDGANKFPNTSEYVDENIKQQKKHQIDFLKYNIMISHSFTKTLESIVGNMFNFVESPK